MSGYTVGQTVGMELTRWDIEARNVLWVTLGGTEKRTLEGSTSYIIALMTQDTADTVNALVTAGKVTGKVLGITAEQWVALQSPAPQAPRPQVQVVERTVVRHGSTCRKCGGPCADGSGHCGEC